MPPIRSPAGLEVQTGLDWNGSQTERGAKPNGSRFQTGRFSKREGFSIERPLASKFSQMHGRAVNPAGVRLMPGPPPPLTLTG
ncbi:hypothetical protein Cp1R7AA1_033 [Mesorhizobium phage Cp1R7A-A1]|nr:hypothetical protein Cp1R7AA1_033 [Mesorhizobium phage Cp1R7A-A1]